MKTICQLKQDWMLEGEAKGMEKGMAKGIVKGKIEGKIEAEHKIIKRCLGNGMSKEEVSQLRGMTMTELEVILYFQSVSCQKSITPNSFLF